MIKLFLSIIGILIIQITYCQNYHYNVLKTGRWNETKKTFDIDTDFTNYNSIISFNIDSSINVVLSNPSNNHEKRVNYKWYKKKIKKVNGYNWDEYQLIVNSQNDYKVISPIYNDKQEIIGINLFNDKEMLLLFNK